MYNSTNMEDEVYFNALAMYENKIKLLSDAELMEHNREDYTESEYDWPEYLDYCDEWRIEYNLIAQRHMQNFVIELAKRKMRIECGNHSHEMRYHDPRDDVSTTSQTGSEIRISSTTSLNMSACWFKTISSAIQIIESETTNHWVAARLPGIMIDVFKTLVKSEMSSRGHTFEILPFDVFSSGLWERGSRAAIKELERQPNQTVKLLMDSFRYHKQIENEDDLFGAKDGEKDLLTTTQEIESDHGFHAFIKSEDQTSRWLKFINMARSKATKDDGSRLTKTRVDAAMARCPRCIRRSGRRALSVPGIYYAPPGSGKTSAMNKEDFIGFDTDWLTSNLRWQDLVELLREEIPIITNQPGAFTGSGMLIVGVFNPNHVRNNQEGKPFTTWQAVNIAKSLNPNMIVLKHEHGHYMNRDLLKMFFLNYVRNTSLHRFMKRRRRAVFNYWRKPVVIQ